MAHENMYSDPNMTCEVLYRTLRAEQEARGGVLPDTLYLQMDNCIRENKNTYVFCYICWLVERGIFKTVYVSFLPVGHTHFDCDRLASRIAIAMKYRDVTSMSQLCMLIEECHHPSPNVETIEAVADVKGLFNPSGSNNCPVTKSRVQRLHGCCTKVPPSHAQQEFMKETSPLHWQARKDLHGKVLLQSKLTCDDDMWSAQHYPWTPSAPRPHGRTFTEGTSGLRPSDLVMCKQKPLADTRAKELETSLQHVKYNLTAEEWEGVKAIWETVATDMHLEDRAVPNAGLFIGEEDDPAERELAQRRHPDAQERLFLRPPSRVFENTNRQAIDRDNRKRRGRANAELVVGNLVALTGLYEDSVPPEERQDFWVGKIIQIDYETEQVRLSMYNTPVLENATSNRATYRNWTGKGRFDWVDISRVLHTFAAFTPKMLVPAMERRRIKAALDLPSDDDDFATGTDVENGKEEAN